MTKRDLERQARRDGEQGAHRRRPARAAAAPRERRARRGDAGAVWLRGGRLRRHPDHPRAAARLSGRRRRAALGHHQRLHEFHALQHEHEGLILRRVLGRGVRARLRGGRPDVGRRRLRRALQAAHHDEARVRHRRRRGRDPVPRHHGGHQRPISSTRATIGGTVKLLGIAKLDAEDPSRISAFVSPVFVPASSTLATINGATNAVQIASKSLQESSSSARAPAASRRPTRA